MKRWWGIRHVRWLIGTYRVHRWAIKWHQMGLGLGVPNEHDLMVLDKIWKGER